MRGKTGKDIICPICGIIKYVPYCHLKKINYCSKKCFYNRPNKQTNTGKTHFKKGFIPWNKNKKGYIGANKTSFKKGQKPWNTNKPRPEIRNENHPNWKGGITPLRKRLWQSYKHTKWRQDIFTRDNYICQICQIKGNYLEADHYPKPFYKIREEYQIKTYEEALKCEELWNINNGRTLCKKCHKNETKKLRKQMLL